MISSMTGFGRGNLESDRLSVTVEIKSVNSRFCEVSVRGPRSISEREIEIQNLIKQTIPRGRISVHVQIDQASGMDARIDVNRPAALMYRDALASLAEELDLDTPVRLDHLLRFPEVIERNESTGIDPEQEWPLIRSATEAAISELADMRLREGEALLADLHRRLDAIEDHLASVNERAPQRVADARTRLTERISELLDDQRVDADRLEFEIALLADKLDVNEEAVRLASHIELFREALQTDEPIGRKLNFIAQEINREINTIGSKSNDSELAHVVVSMKEELEKIREQVENVQ